MTSQWLLKRLGSTYSEFQLDPKEEVVIIGRAIYPSVFISRRHAVFHRSVGDDGKGIRWMLEDLSGGRTFINGFKLTANHKLAIKNGDTICLAINCKTESRAIMDPKLVMLKVHESLSTDAGLNLPPPKYSAKSDGLNLPKNSKSDDKSLIWEKLKNRNELSDIKMTKEKKTDEDLKKLCLERNCKVKAERLPVPMGSDRAIIHQGRISWVEDVKRTQCIPILPNTPIPTVFKTAVLSNIPVKTESLDNSHKAYLQIKSEEDAIPFEDEDDDVQILFSSVDCLKTDVIGEEEEQNYFSQFQTIKSEPMSDDEIIEINSSGSEQEDENLSDDDSFLEFIEELNKSENSYPKIQMEATKRPYNFFNESDQSAPTKLSRKSHPDGEVSTSSHLLSSKSAPEDQLPPDDIAEENFNTENECSKFRKPEIPEKPVATSTKQSNRHAIEIVPLPQPNRKAFLRGISEETVNQLISKNSMKDAPRGKKSSGESVSSVTRKSESAQWIAKASRGKSIQREEISDPNSIKEQRRKKLHEIAHKQSTLNKEAVKKKQDRPMTAKIKVSEPKLSKFQQLERPTARRPTKDGLCTTSVKSNVPKKLIAQKDDSTKASISTYRNKAETIRVEGGYAIKKLRFSNVISNVNSQDPTKVGLSKPSAQPKRFSWQTDLAQESTTSPSTISSGSNDQNLEPAPRKDEEKRRPSNTETKKNDKEIRNTKDSQTAKPIPKFNPLLPSSSNTVKRVSFSSTTPQSSKPVSDQNQTSSRLKENEANANGRSSLPPPKNYPREIKPNETYKSGLERARATLLRWNYQWFEEAYKFKQEKLKKYRKPDCVSEPPGVIGHDMCVNPVSMVFANFKEYCNTFFPLMLHETWASGFKSFEENIAFPKETFSVSIQEKPIKNGVFSTFKLSGPVPNHVSRQQVPTIGCVVVIQLPFQGTRSNKNQQKSNTNWIYVLGIVEDCRFDKVSDRAKSTHPDAKSSILMSITALGSKTENYLNKPFMITPVFRVCNFFKMCKAIDTVRNFPLFRALLQPSKEYFYLWKGDPRLASNITLSQPLILNNEQKLMVSMCSKICSTDPRKPCVMVIQGPPGTGKSSTITLTILQLLSNINPGDSIPKILVCAPSNAAVDNLALKVIHATTGKLFGGRKLNLLRIGDKQKFHPKVHNITLDVLTDQRVYQEVRAISNFDSLRLEMEQLKIEEERLQHEKRKLSSDQSHSLRHEQLKRGLADCYHRKKKIEEKLNELKRDIDPRRRGKAYNDVSNEADIVFSTLSSSMTRILESLCQQNWSRKFSICFVDEASQCVEPEILMPLVLGFNKLVMVGDPAQLPATVVSQVAKKNGYENSMMNRIYKFCQNAPEMKSAVLMLKTQYRMHPDILSLPGRMFYYGDLNTSNLIERDSCLKSYLVFDETSSKETVNGQGSFCNQIEAKVVANIAKAVHEAVRCDKVIRSIGIITFYNHQKHTITKLLRDHSLENHVKVNTVDAFQGSECDIIIISCVRGRSPDSGASIGFVSHEQRINVALTRAKYALYIVGNFDTLKANSMWSMLYDDAKLRSSVVRVQPSCDFGKIIRKPKKAFLH